MKRGNVTHNSPYVQSLSIAFFSLLNVACWSLFKYMHIFGILARDVYSKYQLNLQIYLAGS